MFARPHSARAPLRENASHSRSPGSAPREPRALEGERDRAGAAQQPGAGSTATSETSARDGRGSAQMRISVVTPVSASSTAQNARA